MRRTGRVKAGANASNTSSNIIKLACLMKRLMHLRWTIISKNVEKKKKIVFDVVWWNCSRANFSSKKSSFIKSDLHVWCIWVEFHQTICILSLCWIGSVPPSLSFGEIISEILLKTYSKSIMSIQNISLKSNRSSILNSLMMLLKHPLSCLLLINFLFYLIGAFHHLNPSTYSTTQELLDLPFWIVELMDY